MTEQTMRADTKQLAGAKADLSSLFGTWVNSKPGTDHIARIVVSERDGAVLIRPFGAADGEPVDWGEAVATPFVASGSTEVAGFHAGYTIGAVHTELAANEKLGVLVIQSYTAFDDDSGRLAHYAREFFYRDTGRPGTGVRALAGEWVNSNPATEWITGFTLTERDGTATIQVRGAGSPADWGPAEATLYEDNIGEPAFRAEYHLDGVHAVLAANSNKGLIIIAAFLSFPGEEQTNFLCREFFFRQDSGAEGNAP